MVSRQIQNLSESDLLYLEKLLGEQFAKELEQDSTWQAKNHYNRTGSKKKIIIRCMDAIRSQRKLLTMDKW